MSLEHELLRILGQKKISTCFQPIFHSDGRSLYAYEALSRGPENSSLHKPLQLFTQARQQQKLFVLESICRTSAIEQFSRQQLPGRLFLNVSPGTLQQPDHHRGLTMELINNSGMRPEQVVIEITEHSPIHDFELMRHAVCHYQQEGFSIALDDLGTGYSSLRLWSEVRPEFIKLDRHFVNAIDQDSFKRGFVCALIELAHSVNSLVIAEGIETAGEYQTLHAIGIDYLQGYYFARPVPRPEHYQHQLPCSL